MFVSAMPTGRPAPDVLTNSDGSVTIQYVPTQSGIHEVNVTYNEQAVCGWSLFHFFCATLNLSKQDENDDNADADDDNL